MRKILILGLACASAAFADDAAESKAAFQKVYSVLLSPRCLNCHPKGDRPLQGDDSHVHGQNVKRGTDGKGLLALRCDSCHQLANQEGAHMPPGNPTWHLPSKDMPLTFQGLTAGQLAEQLKDPKRNGNKTLEQLLNHVAEDKLVLWGWNPGNGRTLPPLSHAEFVAAFKTWIDKGAAVP